MRRSVSRGTCNSSSIHARADCASIRLPFCALGRGSPRERPELQHPSPGTPRRASRAGPLSAARSSRWKGPARRHNRNVPGCGRTHPIAAWQSPAPVAPHKARSGDPRCSRRSPPKRTRKAPAPPATTRHGRERGTTAIGPSCAGCRRHEPSRRQHATGRGGNSRPAMPRSRHGGGSARHSGGAAPARQRRPRSLSATASPRHCRHGASADIRARAVNIR